MCLLWVFFQRFGMIITFVVLYIISMDCFSKVRNEHYIYGSLYNFYYAGI